MTTAKLDSIQAGYKEM